VLVGDCGVSRLYKDGIGAAYRTAKSAALGAVIAGVLATDFAKTYRKEYRQIDRDNSLGKLIFSFVYMLRNSSTPCRTAVSFTQVIVELCL